MQRQSSRIFDDSNQNEAICEQPQSQNKRQLSETSNECNTFTSEHEDEIKRRIGNGVPSIFDDHHESVLKIENALKESLAFFQRPQLPDVQGCLDTSYKIMCDISEADCKIAQLVNELNDFKDEIDQQISSANVVAYAEQNVRGRKLGTTSRGALVPPTSSSLASMNYRIRNGLECKRDEKEISIKADINALEKWKIDLLEALRDCNQELAGILERAKAAPRPDPPWDIEGEVRTEKTEDELFEEIFSLIQSYNKQDTGKWSC